MIKKLFSPGLLILGLAACIKIEQVSPIPEIHFKSLDLIDTLDTLGNHIKMGKLKFSFIDGDADFGIDTEFDTTRPDSENYNIFLIPFKKIDTLYYPVEQNSTNPPPYYRLLRADALDRTGQNKTVRGTVTLFIGYYPTPDYDTMRYEFYITDRAFHRSNVETTTDIGFR
jgi:hypothetical protein